MFDLAAGFERQPLGRGLRATEGQLRSKSGPGRRQRWDVSVAESALDEAA